MKKYMRGTTQNIFLRIILQLIIIIGKNSRYRDILKKNIEMQIFT